VSLNRFAILAMMDVLLVAELLLAIHFARQDMAEIGYTFLKVFLPLAVPTVVTARIALRRWAPQDVRDQYRPVGIVGPLGGNWKDRGGA
jgi:low temperature requirement protein LtrA